MRSARFALHVRHMGVVSGTRLGSLWARFGRHVTHWFFGLLVRPTQNTRVLLVSAILDRRGSLVPSSRIVLFGSGHLVLSSVFTNDDQWFFDFMSVRNYLGLCRSEITLVMS